LGPPETAWVEPLVGTVSRFPEIVLLLPTLNEIEGLRATLPHIDFSLFAEVIVVDGGSKDGTIDYALASGATVVSQIRAGLQYAIYDIARAVACDYVVEFSPDGNCKTEHLPDLVAKLREGYDLVVVSRYLGTAKSDDDHLISALGNWLFTRLMRLLSSFPMTDCLNIYRGFRRDLLLDPDFEFYLKGPVLEPLTSGLCALRHGRIAEIPGDEPERIGGETKRGVIYNGSLVLLMILRLYARKFFGVRL
jgi:glycosyltransferase involved in cell wall biosynthesis